MKTKTFLFVVAVLLHLNGCKSLGTFKHQLGPEDAHSLIEVIPPDKTLRDMQLNGEFDREWSATIIEVDEIDGIPVPYRPGKNQGFRVNPGKHEIKYKTTSVGYAQLDEPISEGLLGLVFVFSGASAYGGKAPNKLYGTEYTYVTNDLYTVTGRRYR